MKKHKPVEYGIAMNLEGAVLLQQSDLNDKRIEKYYENHSPCHIYIICKRPKIYINPDSFKLNDNLINLNFRVQKGHEFKELSFSTPHPFNKGEKVSLDTEFPYNYFKLKGEKSGIVSSGKASLVLQSAREEFEHQTNMDFLDLEVIYVGQSYGKDGERTAIQRIRSHSTLQQIYSDANNKYIDQDVWILLCSFEQINMLAMNKNNGTEKEFELDWEKRSKNTFTTLMGGKFTGEQTINFTEAALIRYFQPKYNEIFKDSFPSKTHKSYEECYNLDVNSVVVGLDIFDMVKCKLYTEKVKRRKRHLITYNLHSKEDRKSMFNL